VNNDPDAWIVEEKLSTLAKPRMRTETAGRRNAYRRCFARVQSPTNTSTVRKTRTAIRSEIEHTFSTVLSRFANLPSALRLKIAFSSNRLPASVQPDAGTP
jgi:hypothetical protein